jgi:hypothetical protein
MLMHAEALPSWAPVKTMVSRTPAFRQRNAEIEPRHAWITKSASGFPCCWTMDASLGAVVTTLPPASKTGCTGVLLDGTQRGPTAGNTPRGSGKIHSRVTFGCGLREEACRSAEPG